MTRIRPTKVLHHRTEQVPDPAPTTPLSLEQRAGVQLHWEAHVLVVLVEEAVGDPQGPSEMHAEGSRGTTNQQLLQESPLHWETTPLQYTLHI